VIGAFIPPEEVQKARWFCFCFPSGFL